MTLDEIKQLIEFIKGQELTEFELEQDGFKIRIKSGQSHQVVAMPHMSAPMPMMAAPMQAAPGSCARRSRRPPPRTTMAASCAS